MRYALIGGQEAGYTCSFLHRFIFFCRLRAFASFFFSCFSFFFLR